MEYNFREIEAKWQAQWRADKTYQTKEDPSKPKYYVLDMFPYPSGAGLHVGHPLGYIASDIVSRYKRLKGFNVLHPMGYDAFGLPAEQYAIQTGQHPKVTTDQNIARYRSQLDQIGFSFDWSREIRTCEPDYYKWTQWIFIRLFHSWYNNNSGKAEPIETLIRAFEKNGSDGINAACGEPMHFTAGDWNSKTENAHQEILLNYRLAYLSDAWVNWCPALGTVLANDEVKDGVSERGGYPVERRRMPQWSLRITAYAERLLRDLDSIDWTESIKEAQRNWIGRSEGSSIKFRVKKGKHFEGALASPQPSPKERASHPASEDMHAEEGTSSSQHGMASPQPSPKERASHPASEDMHAEEGTSSSQHGMASPQPSPKERASHPASEDMHAEESAFHYLTADTAIYKKLKQFVRELRDNSTNAEDELWQVLRNNQLGYKIRRQHPIGPYIADFICIAAKLIIEVDGDYHKTAEQIEIDDNRTSVLNDLGFKVLRFTNAEVLNSINKVQAEIYSHLKINLPSPLERGTGGEAKMGQGGEVFPNSKAGVTSGDKVSSSEIDHIIEVFTTRPDTIFGVSFVTLAPEHELVDILTTAEYRTAVTEYVTAAKNRSERERQADVKRISGQFTGAYVLHPFTGEDIPVWVGDYVLSGYGTGAVMAVPAHDSRDFAFAKHFGLPIKQVIAPPADSGHENFEVSSYDEKEGRLINSEFLNDLEVKLAIRQAIDEIEKHSIGKGRVNYRLRDAAFGRQRYWGEPIPIYYKNGIPYTIDEQDLPLILPEIDKFQPTEDGDPPLGRAVNWKYKGEYDYELTTMPGWAGSSWYFLRYMDAKNNSAFVSKEASAYWKNVDLYMGGAEHATGHLLYVRFWTKFLYDLGYIPVEEPAQKLINQGMIQGVSAFVHRINGTNEFVSDGLKKNYDTTSIHVDVSLAPNHELNLEGFKNWRTEFKDATFIFEDGKYTCGSEVEKMSKSKYNVVNPDDIINEYGADTLRLYEMFLGPLEQSKPWSTQGISGVHNFLRRFWRLFHSNNGEFFLSDEAASPAELKTLHKTLKKVEEDIERFSFNTTVSSFMICVNELTDLKCNKRSILEPLLIALCPSAPHFCEELWALCGHSTSITQATFPAFNEQYLVEDSFEYPVSINGKVKFKMNLSLKLTKEEIEKSILDNSEMSKFVQGAPKKVIVVPGRIVNVVV